jgi:hypothetical protein
MVSYTPVSPADLNLLGLFTQTDPCLCGPTNADIGPEPAAVGFNGFSVAGKCGCPAIDTWDNPMSIVIGFGAGTCGFQNLPYNTCVLACDCEYINSPDIKIASGAEVFTWFCEDFYPDPFNPVRTDCTRVVKWYDICEHLFTVSVS